MEKHLTIALFGGTGFVGGHMLQLLMRQGFNVRMMVRSNSGIESGDNLFLVEGDLKSGVAIKETLNGADAVIVMTGPRSGSIDDMRIVVEGTKLIVQSMESQGIKRLLKLSGVSVRLKDEPFPLPRRLLDIGLGLAMKYPSKSKYLEQEIIQSSDLDWTVIRPPVISKRLSSKPIQAHDYAFLGMSVSVEKLCEFFLSQIDSDQWIRKSPTVG